MDNAFLYVTELTDIAGVHRTNPVPPMFTLAEDQLLPVPLNWVRQTPVKPRPTHLHLPRRTLAPPDPQCEPSYHRWELSTIPPRLIIYPSRVGLEPSLPVTRLLTYNPQTIYTLFPQRLWSHTSHG